MTRAASSSPGAGPSQTAAISRADFRALYDAHFAFVWRTLLHFGVLSSRAEDVAQEVFVTLHRRLDDYDGSTSVRSWLWGICRYAAQGERRSALREQRRVSVAPEPAATPLPDAALERRRAIDFVQETLASMPDDLRDAFVLMEIEGLSAPDAAQAVGTNLNTMYSRLRLARAHFERASSRLRAKLENEKGARSA